MICESNKFCRVGSSGKGLRQNPIETLPYSLVYKYAPASISTKLHCVFFITKMYSPGVTLAVTIDMEPESLNVSINEEALFSCSAYNSDDISWIRCTPSPQNEAGECMDVNFLNTMGSESKIDSDVNIDVNPAVSNLTILILDDMQLLEELNDTHLHCRAVSFSEQKFANSSSAKLLFQGELSLG